jgi:large subunit ribosomal protein L3
LGQNIEADIFNVGEVVDVTGISKGKGTQGVIKRNNQTRGPMGHGSKYHRGVGSLGTRRPKHVIKGKILPGHMGSEKTTMQNLVIVATDAKENIILVSGNIPGAKKSMVMIKPAVKKPKKVLKVDELVDFSVKAEPTTTEENK